MTTRRLAASGSTFCGFAALATVALGACSDPASTGSSDATGNNLGVEGASCLRTPDCESPLQCLVNVCRSSSGNGPDATSDAGDTTGAETSDTFVAPDTFPTDTRVADSDGFDGSVPDVPESFDASGWELIEDTVEEATLDAHTDADLFAGCEALGISEHWSGPFDGLIEFHVTPNPLTPSDGFLPVEGTLSFDITCVGTKLVVKGTMSGTATIEGQDGSFPFELSIQGFYNPTAHKLQANLVDGSVNIYGLVEVYFEGEFLGEIAPGGDDFAGTWTGHSTGTNQSFITGTAEGDGTWGASPL